MSLTGGVGTKLWVINFISLASLYSWHHYYYYYYYDMRKWHYILFVFTYQNTAKIFPWTNNEESNQVLHHTPSIPSENICYLPYLLLLLIFFSYTYFHMYQIGVILPAVISNATCEPEWRIFLFISLISSISTKFQNHLKST